MDSPPLASLIDVMAISVGAVLILGLLLGHRGNRGANRWLAGFVLALALLSAGDLVIHARWDDSYPQLAHLTDWIIFLVGPLLWMYVRRLTFNDRPTARRWLWNLVPALLCLAIFIPFYFAPIAAKRAVLAAERAEADGHFDPVLLIAAAHVFFYWIASYFTVSRYHRRLHDSYSSLERRRFQWLAALLAINFVMWLCWLAGLVIRADWAEWVGLVGVPAGLYLFALLGLRQPALSVESASVSPAEAPAAESTRYDRSGLDAAQIPRFLEQLDAVMRTEKPWLESDLTLRQLAERAGLTPHHLSQLLNEKLGVSFYDYVNRERVREVERCFRDPAYAGETVLAIALASGFGSKTVFNTVFRQQFGETPSAYRRRNGPAPA